MPLSSIRDMGVAWLSREPKTAATPPPIERFQGLGEVSAPAYMGSSGGLLSTQQEAMVEHVKVNGLARFSVSIVADTGSRVQLMAEKFNAKENEWERSNDAFVNEVIRQFQGRFTDQQQTLWYHLFHRRTTGERYQVREFDPATGRVYHSVYSPLAVERIDRTGSFRVHDRAGDKGVIHPAQNVNRMWWPDPFYPLQPWSSLWAGLSDLQRYHLLGRVISRTASSSMLARGIMWVPKEGLGRIVTHKGKQRRQLQAEYYDAANDKMNAADDSVAAVVPYLMHYGNDFKEPSLISFSLPFDAQLLPLRAEALESFARAADLPSSLLINGGPGGGQTGSGGAPNHITDLLVDRRYFDHTVAPQVDAVLHYDLTKWYLRPALEAAAMNNQWDGEADKFRIGYDPANVIIPADKSQTALVAYRSGLLSMDSTLRAIGFKPEDAPKPGELAKIIEVMTAMNQGIRQGDANMKANGQTPRGEVSANGNGTAVRTPV